MATVLLGLSENNFWRMTPRKLMALWRQYKKWHQLESTDNKVYIDQIF